MSIRTTKTADVVFEFKRKYYLTELLKRDFNLLKTSIEIEASRQDMHNHLGFTHEERVALARNLGMIE